MKLVPQKDEECYTLGKILEITVKEDTIINNLKPVLRQVYNLKTEYGSLQIVEITKRNIMKKCIESGGKIQFVPYGPVVSGFELSPVCSSSPDSVHIDSRDSTTLFVEFQDKCMVSPKKTVWTTTWAFVDGKQIV